MDEVGERALGADATGFSLAEEPASSPTTAKTSSPAKSPATSPTPDRWSSPGGFVSRKIGFYNAYWDRSGLVPSNSSTSSTNSSRGIEPVAADSAAESAAGPGSGGREDSAGSGRIKGQLFGACHQNPELPLVVVSSMASAPPSGEANLSALKEPPLTAIVTARGNSSHTTSSRPLKLPALWPEEHADPDAVQQQSDSTLSSGKAGTGAALASSASASSAPAVPASENSSSNAPSQAPASAVPPALQAGKAPVDQGGGSNGSPAPSAPSGAAATYAQAAPNSGQHTGGNEVPAREVAEKASQRASVAGQVGEAPAGRGHAPGEAAEHPAGGTNSEVDVLGGANQTAPGGQARSTPPSAQGKRAPQAAGVQRAAGDRPKGGPQERSPSSAAVSPKSAGSPGPKKFTVPQPFQLATDRRAMVNRGSSGPALASPPAKAASPGLIRASLESPQVPPRPAPKPTTSPEPFNLESVRRHEDAQGRLRAEMEAKERAERELHRFKAQPVALPAPVAAPKSIPPTAAEGFHFSSDERAEKRREKMEEKEKEKEKEKQQEKASRHTSKEDDPHDLKEYRKSLAFKASPLPSFYKEPAKPAEARKSSQPPTRAVSPKLGRKDKPAVATHSREDSTALSTDPKAPDKKQAKPTKVTPKSPTKMAPGALGGPGPAAAGPQASTTDDAAVAKEVRATNGLGG